MSVDSEETGCITTDLRVWKIRLDLGIDPTCLIIVFKLHANSHSYPWVLELCYSQGNWLPQFNMLRLKTGKHHSQKYFCYFSSLGFFFCKKISATFTVKQESGSLQVICDIDLILYICLRSRACKIPRRQFIAALLVRFMQILVGFK